MDFKKMSYLNALAILSTILMFSFVSIDAQISTPCTNSMINSFTPCLNYITGSIGSSGASPTIGCCDSVRSLMSTSVDCTCLIITGNVPFSLPINRTLAISLPRACKAQGVPIQCKASGVPLPAPGPVLFGPTAAPAADSPLSPTASKVVSMAPAPPPVDEEEPSTPDAPTTSPGIRPVLNQPASSSNPTYSASSPFVLFVLLVLVFNNY